MEAEKVNETLNDVEDGRMLFTLAASLAGVNPKTLLDTLTKVKAIRLGDKVSDVDPTQ